MEDSDEELQQPQPHGLLHFIHAHRELVDGEKDAVRLVHKTELLENNANLNLAAYVADRAPLFYRSLESVIQDLRDGFFLTAMQSTLARMPTAESFRESHFGEIAAAIFAEEVLGLRKLYSKLSLLTAENSNAYKMDLLLYDPNKEPIEFVFGEVKSSPKHESDGLPARHDKSCYADLFNSIRKYNSTDQSYDLAAARDNLSKLPQTEQQKVRAALLPYSGATTAYAGFLVIDQSTFDLEEAQVLRTRRSKTELEIDLICVESYSTTAAAVYEQLDSSGGPHQSAS
ncbi:MAG: Hachiman antiphage defense system protein HamA [Verrucomicrobiota bacterium]